MTANQIMIPIAGVLLVASVAYLILRTRKINAAKAQRTHRPNAPATGHDNGAIARSVAEGHGSANQF
jgi:hypothetical protein